MSFSDGKRRKSNILQHLAYLLQEASMLLVVAFTSVQHTWESMILVLIGTDVTFRSVLREEKQPSILSWSLLIHASTAEKLGLLCFLSLHVSGSVLTLYKLAWSISAHVLRFLLGFMKGEFPWVHWVSVCFVSDVQQGGCWLEGLVAGNRWSDWDFSCRWGFFCCLLVLNCS